MAAIKQAAEIRRRQLLQDAAPDLIAACELQMRALDEHLREFIACYETEDEGWERLAQRLRIIGPDVFDPNYRVRAALATRAAIAKARGEQQ